MAITEEYEQLAQELIANSADEIIAAVPVGSRLIIKHMTIVNPSGGACWVKLWTAGTSDVNLILPQVSIEAGGWGEFDGTITLHAGVTLSAQAQTNDVLTITIHGVELVTS